MSCKSRIRSWPEKRKEAEPPAGPTRCDVAPNFYPTVIGVWGSVIALLGGDGGGPRSGAVGGAQRSGPPYCGVAGWAHPAEPRVRPVVVVKFFFCLRIIFVATL